MNDDPIVERAVAELGPFSRTLQREFERVVPVVRPVLSEAGFSAWCDEAVTIARSSFRSWETSAEYLKVSPEMVRAFHEPDFLQWAAVGRDLTGASSSVASAYFQASPSLRRLLTAEQFPIWAALGRSLHGESWKSISLATRFFEQSGLLLREISLDQLAVCVQFLVALSTRSYEAAADCLEHGQRILSSIPPADRTGFLELAGRLAPLSWKPAQVLFKEGPAVLRGIDPGLRPKVLALAARLTTIQPDDTFTFLRDCANALNQIDAAVRESLLDMATGLFEGSWKAVVELLKSGPKVRRRAGDEGLHTWYDHGREVLAESEEAGTAYFRLQSSRANRMLEMVSPGIEFSSVRDLLRVYCQALAGTDTKVISTEDLTDRAIGWTRVERPATDGYSIHLPPYVEEYGEKTENFAAYKVLATHQTGHLEFGTFLFDLERPAAVHSENQRFSLLPESPALPYSDTPTPHNPFERFFDAFPVRQLAKDLFMVAEDYRVDRQILREYPGIRRQLLAVQHKALGDRPNEPRPLWELMVETVIRVSLEETLDLAGLAARPIAAFLTPLTDPRATVEDSAEAACRLYGYLTQVPNIPMGELPQGDLDAVDDGSPITGLESGGEQRAGEPYEGPAPVGYRDDLKPELIEAMARARTEEEQGAQSGGMSPDELRKLLEKSGEIDLGGLSEGEVTKSLGLFVNNLLREAGQRSSRPQPQDRVTGTPEGARQANAERHGLSATEPKVFLYDEWDFRANDYRPQWCRLKEQVLKEGSTEFFDRTLESYSALVSDIRRQFERLRPEAFKKLKRLQDGEEYDLDAVVEAVVERRAHRTPSDKIYWRKNKLDRNVAVAFLLDMSASTDEEIEDRPRPSYYPDTLTTFRWSQNSQWHWQWDEPMEEPRKRIIDVEKESLVLLIKALETIGDTYGIYGFSGYGRENVEFFVIKDLAEQLSDRVKRRVEKISPVQGTRMGPAIRHCISKLDSVDAKLKLLVLVSDGRPQDHDYGKDRTEKEYAIHDTRMALLEAKRRAVVPFCLTVDRFGHDYLKAMCGDIGYEVVSNIEGLPKRLPTLYRRLTT